VLFPVFDRIHQPMRRRGSLWHPRLPRVNGRDNDLGKTACNVWSWSCAMWEKPGKLSSTALARPALARPPPPTAQLSLSFGARTTTHNPTPNQTLQIRLRQRHTSFRSCQFSYPLSLPA
jgi:hypothetical protein